MLRKTATSDFLQNQFVGAVYYKWNVKLKNGV